MDRQSIRSEIQVPRRSRRSRVTLVGTVALALQLAAPGCAPAPATGESQPEGSASAPLAGPADPLPSWNDTAPKRAIVAFVERVTREGSPDFVPVPERIATFDNDGTLWAEQPITRRCSSSWIASRSSRRLIRS